MAKKKVETVVEVEQNPDKPIAKPILAQAIVDIGAAIKKLSRNSGLNRRAIITLVGRDTQLNYNIIERVMDGLESLEKNYCD